LSRTKGHRPFLLDTQIRFSYIQLDQKADLCHVWDLCVPGEEDGQSLLDPASPVRWPSCKKRCNDPPAEVPERGILFWSDRDTAREGFRIRYRLPLSLTDQGPIMR